MATTTTTVSKNNSGFMSKTTTLCVHHALYISLTSTTAPLRRFKTSLKMRCFMEDVNIRRRIFLSFFEQG